MSSFSQLRPFELGEGGRFPPIFNGSGSAADLP
jgi:hypothetical protein